MNVLYGQGIATMNGILKISRYHKATLSGYLLRLHGGESLVLGGGWGERKKLLQDEVYLA